jgi:cobalamin transport system substrate-binding protein
MPLAVRLGRRRREGAPSQKTSARRQPIEPLAEGGFVFKRAIVVAAFVAVFAVLSGAAVARPAAFPHRIVSLSPSTTESLFAIGAGKQVVAVDNQSDYPKNAPRTSLSGYTPNLEAIAGYHPDLVIVSGDEGGVIEGLKRLGIRVLLQAAPKDLNGTYAEIRQLGVVTGHKKAATRLVGRMRARIAQIVKSARRPRLAVYHELDPTYYSVTSKTFIGRIYTLFGLRNIADAADTTGSGYPQLSAEYIVAANPRLIVLADSRCCGQTATTVASRPGWSGIAAVRGHAVIAVDDSIASRWGPRIVDFVAAIGAALRKIGR